MCLVEHMTGIKFSLYSNTNLNKLRNLKDTNMGTIPYMGT